MDEWLQRLDALGLRPGEVLGEGVEGVVVRLAGDLVAKVWHDRPLEDLLVRQRFGTALAGAGLRLHAPVVLDVVDLGGRCATVEPWLAGTPLVTAAPGTAPVVDHRAADAVVDVLAALADVSPYPDLAVLPVLPDEPPLELTDGFEAALAGLVEHRVARSRRALLAAVPALDELVAAVVAALRALPPAPASLVHGDLIAANILVGEDVGPRRCSTSAS